MDANIPPLIQQYVFHGVALVQLILAVYFLVFNLRNTINRLFVVPVHAQWGGYGIIGHHNRY